jgi:hypothetical protein
MRLENTLRVKYSRLKFIWQCNRRRSREDFTGREQVAAAVAAAAAVAGIEW